MHTPVIIAKFHLGAVLTPQPGKRVFQKRNSRECVRAPSVWLWPLTPSTTCAAKRLTGLQPVPWTAGAHLDLGGAIPTAEGALSGRAICASHEH